MRLIIRNLTKIIDNKAVLNKVSYTFEQGRVYGLAGENDSVKSLLFRCVSNEMSVNRGYVRLLKEGREYKVTCKDIGCIYNNSDVLGVMTGREFIKYYMELHGENADAAAVEDYLKFIGISVKDRGRLICDYSESLKFRLQMLCMYIWAPAVIFIEDALDECNDKDLELFHIMLDKLKKDHIVIVSSNKTDLIRKMCDEIVVINDGVLMGEILNV